MLAQRSGERPRAVDLLGGSNGPVSRALQWCGWEVILFDWAVGGADHDIRQESVRAAVREAVAEADATVVAMDCGTFSRVREVPRKGAGTAPPCRSAAHPRGFPWLSRTDPALDRQVQEANDNGDFLTDMLALADDSGAAGVAENPRNSYWWQQPRVKQLGRRRGWQD